MECPYCGKEIFVETDYDPIYYLSKPATQKSEKKEAGE